MVLAALRDDFYNVVLVLHIVAVVIAFAPAVAHPLTLARMKRGGPGAVAGVSGAMVDNTRSVYLPALLAVGLLGALMVPLSDDAWGFDQAWVGAALVVWLAIGAVVSAVILPGERAMAAGDPGAEKRVAIGGQLATVGVLVVLWLMIWKPGV